MKYSKPPLTLDEQADLLIRRGMTGDRALMVSRLASVSYYRLSGYWYPFRNADDSFRAGTSFDVVWQRYVFDRRLRLLIMDAIERIEVAVRTQLAHHHALFYGAFAYGTNLNSLPKLAPARYQEFLDHIADETNRSRERFVAHFRRKYGDEHRHLPVWMMAEVMAFGTVLTFYRGASHRVKQSVASVFGMPDTVFNSWLLTLSAVRNICAHHGRLWNRELGVKPFIPLSAKYPDWHKPVAISNRRVFGVLTICRWCLRKIAPQSQWAGRLRTLLDSSPEIPLPSLGFPANWNQSPIWAPEAALGEPL